MAKNYDHQKSLRTTGIMLVVIAAGVLLALIWAIIWNDGNARKYTTDVTGTVISSSIFHRLDREGHLETYSDVTIQYNGLNGSQHTIKCTQLYGEYKEGDTISLRSNEEMTEAVPEWDTEQNPIFICCLSVLSLFFGGVGFWLIKGKANG